MKILQRFILFLFLNLVFISGLHAQKYGSDFKHVTPEAKKIPDVLLKEIPLNLENVSLEFALTEISKSGKVKFNYNRDRIDLSKRITLKQKEVTIIQALDLILQQAGLILFIASDTDFAIIPPDKSKTAFLRGFVKDADSGEPLPVANVVIPALGKGSATNLDGYFVIPAVPGGMHKIEVTYMGYEKLEKEILVSGGDNEILEFKIKRNIVSFNEVTFKVDYDREENRISPNVSSISVTPEVLRTLPSLGAESDLMRSAQMLPGVKASSEMSSALYVRGGDRDMTLLALDQSTVYNPSHFFGMFSTFNSDAVKYMELKKGGFSAEYGGRAGSVLEVVTNDGNRNKTKGLIYQSFLSSRGAIEGPLPKDKGSYAFSARRTYYDPIIKILRKQGKDFKSLPSYYFYDTNGKVTFDLTKKTILTISGYLGKDVLDGNFGDEYSREILKTDWGNRTFSTRLRQVAGQSGFFNAAISYSHYISNFNNFNENILLGRFTNNFKELMLRGDYEYQGLENHKIKTGIYINRYISDFKINNEEVVFLDIDASLNNYSLYLQDSYRFSTRWEVRPGLRGYIQNKDKQYQFDPRLALVHYYGPDLRFKLAGGRYTQLVNLIAHGQGFSALDIWTPADGSVDPTYADQLVLGVEYETEKGTEVTLETYYNQLKNVLIFDESKEEANTIRDAYISGEGVAYGFEALFRRKTGKYTGWIGYSLSWTKRRFKDSQISNGDWFYPKWDRRHDFIVTGMVRHNNKWSTSASWRYGTGQGYTRGIGIMGRDIAYLDPQLDMGNGREVLYGGRNNERLPAEHRLDLTFTYDHTFFGKPAKLNISIYNVYNRKAIWMRKYYTESNPVREKDVSLLPILPLLGYEVRF